MYTYKFNLGAAFPVLEYSSGWESVEATLAALCQRINAHSVDVYLDGKLHSSFECQAAVKLAPR